MANFVSIVEKKRKGWFDSPIPDYVFPFKFISADTLIQTDEIIVRTNSMGTFHFFKLSSEDNFSIKIGEGQCVHAILGNFATGGILCFDNGTKQVIKNMHCWISRHAPDVNPWVF